MSSITMDRIRELFIYNDGDLMRRLDGSLFGGANNIGYVVGRVDGKTRLIHRLIYLYHHGFLPKAIDHINGDPEDNRIDNLRASNTSENRWNSKTPSTNKTGVKGVSYRKDKGKYLARVEKHGKEVYLGYFDNIDDAELSVRAARDSLHGKFARHV